MIPTAYRSVNSAGAVCDQKTSRFFVSHQKESMAGHVGVNGIYLKLGNRNTKGSMVGPRRKPEDESTYFCLSGAFKT
jgi:hypothetical protein